MNQKKEAFEKVFLSLSEIETELKNLMHINEISEVKLLEKSVAYEELMKDFHALMEETAIRDKELNNLKDNFRSTHKLSLTQEEDILK